MPTLTQIRHIERDFLDRLIARAENSAFDLFANGAISTFISDIGEEDFREDTRLPRVVPKRTRLAQILNDTRVASMWVSDEEADNRAAQEIKNVVLDDVDHALAHMESLAERHRVETPSMDREWLMAADAYRLSRYEVEKIRKNGD